ncbi:TetR/AcrR family transcriptional regulator [Salinifilum ghardaiensis]
MVADTGTRLRADAQRNRDQILAAAREMFAQQGPDAPMEEIARTAGVGVGTLYRRFPDREALIRAVAQESFAQVLEDARAASAEEATGWDALVRLINRSHQLKVSVQLALVSERAREILQGDPKTGELRDALLDELAQILDSAQAEGSVRADVSAGDIALLFSLMLRQPPAADGPEEQGIDRAVAIMFDGLRTGSHGPLPGRPVTTEDLRR